MITRFRTIKMLAIALVAVFIMVGCETDRGKNYTGEYPELYSVAINSLLGSTGYSVSERRYDSTVELIEEDDYGRKLFYYNELHPVNADSLLISQKNDDEYVYFYPDYNFISIPLDEMSNVNWREKTYVENFSAEAIEELKMRNDWNMEVNLDNCMKVDIVRQKEKGSVRNRDLNRLYNLALGEDASNHASSKTFFIEDAYGRSIYLGHGTFTSRRWVVMLFQPNGTFDESRCLMELHDTQNYQDELRLFKELNDWNQPLPSNAAN